MTKAYRKVVFKGVERIVGPALDVTVQHAQDMVVGMLNVAYEAGCKGVRHPQHFWVGDVQFCKTNGTLPPALLADYGVDCQKCLRKSPASAGPKDRWCR